MSCGKDLPAAVTWSGRQSKSGSVSLMCSFLTQGFAAVVKQSAALHTGPIRGPGNFTVGRESEKSAAQAENQAKSRVILSFAEVGMILASVYSALHPLWRLLVSVLQIGQNSLPQACCAVLLSEHDGGLVCS